MPRERVTPISDVALHLGDRVYELRHKHRMTQHQLAKAVGCSPTTISELERQKIGDVSLVHLVALARVLGTTTDDLLGLAKDRTDG